MKSENNKALILTILVSQLTKTKACW